MKVSIKALRINAELSQQEASDEIGVTVRTLQNWENNITAPTAPQLVTLCRVYGCTLDDIFLPNKLAKSEN